MPKQQSHEPNEATARTLTAAKVGQDLHHAEDSADLFAQLGIEEAEDSAHTAPDVAPTKETRRRASCETKKLT